MGFTSATAPTSGMDKGGGLGQKNPPPGRPALGDQGGREVLTTRPPREAPPNPAYGHPVGGRRVNKIFGHLLDGVAVDFRRQINYDLRARIGSRRIKIQSRRQLRLSI